MEKTLAILDTIVDSLRRLQSKVSSLEVQRKSLASKGDLKELKYSFELKLKELREELKLLDKKYKKLSEPIEDKIKSLESKLNALEVSISNLVSIEEFSKVNVELFNLSSELDSLKETISKFNDLQIQVQTINEDLNKLFKQISKIQSEVDKLEKISNPDAIKSKLDHVNNSIEILSKHVSNLEEVYDSVKNKLDEIEREAISNIYEDLSTLKQVNEDRFKAVQKEIGELEYLKEITREDIRKLKNIQDTTYIQNKVIELERKINTLNGLINELSKVLYQVRGSLSKISQDATKVIMLEKTIKQLESDYQNIQDTLKALKREITDIKDVAMITARENERIEHRLSQLETKLKIENIDEVLEAFERVKLIEEDLRNLKQGITRQAFTFEPSNELALRVKHLENAVKRLYEQQNAILYSLNEKLAKLEKAIAKT